MLSNRQQHTPIHQSFNPREGVLIEEMLTSHQVRIKHISVDIVWLWLCWLSQPLITFFNLLKSFIFICLLNVWMLLVDVRTVERTWKGVLPSELGCWAPWQRGAVHKSATLWVQISLSLTYKITHMFTLWPGVTKGTRYCSFSCMCMNHLWINFNFSSHYFWWHFIWIICLQRVYRSICNI